MMDVRQKIKLNIIPCIANKIYTLQKYVLIRNVFIINLFCFYLSPISRFLSSTCYITVSSTRALPLKKTKKTNNRRKMNVTKWLNPICHPFTNNFTSWNLELYVCDKWKKLIHEYKLRRSDQTKQSAQIIRDCIHIHILYAMPYEIQLTSLSFATRDY